MPSRGLFCAADYFAAVKFFIMNEPAKAKKDWRRKEVKRIKRIAIYLTEAEYAFVQESSRKAGLEFSSYIRGMTMQGKVNARLNEEDRHLFRGLVEMSNDLHQLVRMARESGLTAIASSFEVYRDRIDELLNKNNL